MGEVPGAEDVRRNGHGQVPETKHISGGKLREEERGTSKAGRCVCSPEARGE